MLRRIDYHLWISSTPTTAMIKECDANAVFSCVKKGPPAEVVQQLTRYHQILIPDGSRLPKDLFRAAVLIVERWLLENYTVLIHCNAGRNRSCTVAALILARRRGITGAEALAHVRRCRPNAVGSNPVFEEWLMRGDITL